MPNILYPDRAIIHAKKMPPFLLWSVFIAILCPCLLPFDNLMAQPTTMTTTPKPSFSFVVWGHPRGPSWKDLPTHADEIVSRLRELKPDLLIVTGDAIEGMYGMKPNADSIQFAWDTFDSVVQRAGIPMHIAPGNHDVMNPVTREIFLERYPKVPYAFTHKGVRFVILDTVGLDRQVQGDPIYQPGLEGISWFAGAMPFDEPQRNFIRREIHQQDQYAHMFFFMHHTKPWAEPDGFWSQEIHPLLLNGKTRAIFSGNPAYGKYAYLEKDGIFYMQNAVYETLPPEWFVWRRHYPPTPQYKQFDNLQLVTVAGNKVRYEPIILGWLQAEGLSIAYWKNVDLQFQWNHRLEKWFHQTFFKLHHIAFLILFLVMFGMMSGAFFYKVWNTRRPSTSLKH